MSERGGPALLCYDGSDFAKRAIEEAGALLGGGPAVVLTVWESVGSGLLRHPAPGRSQFAQSIREISEDVVAEFDQGVAESAQATADEGAKLAAAVGFEARALAQRAIARAAERDEVTVWRAVVDAADDLDAAVVVLGSRGRSALSTAVLGSVSYGVMHHSARPVLLVPAPG